MVNGPTVAVMIAITTVSGCSGNKVGEHVGVYKDMKTCTARVTEIKNKYGYQDRYCRLEGVIEELDYDK